MANPIKVLRNLIEAQQNLGDFIANGPATGLPGYVRDRYRDRCDQFANIPDWALALSPIAKQSISNWCEPYWEDQGVDGPTDAPPFTGGQCFGTNYAFDFNYTSDQGVPQTIGNQSSGKIVGTFVGAQQPNLLFPIGFERQQSPGGPIERINQASVQDPGNAAPSISNLVALNGPDDCGDPPSDFKPGPNPPADPGPLPGPEPTDDPTGSPFPSFPIPDWPGPFGDYPIVGPNDEVDFNPDDLPVGGGDGLPGDGGAIGGPAGEVNGDEGGQEIDFGPPPEGRIWVGCIVDIIVDSRIGNIPGTGPQSTVWPSVRGNVALKYSSLFGTSRRINSRYTELFRPNTALTVTGCFLQVQPGGSGLVFPISALTCPLNPCGDQNG